MSNISEFPTSPLGKIKLTVHERSNELVSPEFESYLRSISLPSKDLQNFDDKQIMRLWDVFTGSSEKSQKRMISQLSARNFFFEMKDDERYNQPIQIGKVIFESIQEIQNFETALKKRMYFINTPVRENAMIAVNDTGKKVIQTLFDKQ